jgi:hypothetical protein
MSVEILDEDHIAWLDDVHEDAHPSLRWEALEIVWKYSLSAHQHPPGPALADRLQRLSHAAWRVALADDEPRVH